MNVDEVNALRSSGYNPYDFINRNEKLRRVIGLIESDFFSPGEHGIFKPILDSFHYDTYMTAADFESYDTVQKSVSELYRNPEEWNRRCLFNIANMGMFSSDRSIQDYATKIWNLKPVKVEMENSIVMENSCSCELPETGTKKK